MMVGLGSNPEIAPPRISPNATATAATYTAMTASLDRRTGRVRFPAAASPGRSGTSFTYRISATRIPTGSDAYSASHENTFACTTYAPSTMTGPKPRNTAISPSPRWTRRSGGAV